MCFVAVSWYFPRWISELVFSGCSWNGKRFVSVLIWLDMAWWRAETANQLDTTERWDRCFFSAIENATGKCHENATVSKVLSQRFQKIRCGQFVFLRCVAPNEVWWLAWTTWPYQSIRWVVFQVAPQSQQLHSPSRNSDWTPRRPVLLCSNTETWGAVLGRDCRDGFFSPGRAVVSSSKMSRHEKICGD